MNCVFQIVNALETVTKNNIWLENEVVWHAFMFFRKGVFPRMTSQVTISHVPFFQMSKQQLQTVQFGLSAVGRMG